jgi:non-canonical purine NTP pyrophosphatase (RdgB/HAM1 family)
MILTPAFEIVIATHNPGKVREVREALESLPVKLRYLEEFAHISPVDEVGQTYEENSVLKALGYAKQTRVCALADDSGLEVDALGGAPGVFSARFAGEHASDHDRIQKLLAALSKHQGGERNARFVCSMALAGWQTSQEQSDGTEPQLLTVTERSCEGAIGPAGRGTNGFGFDPLFVPSGYFATFAELPTSVKSKISHRAQALAAIRAFLEGWLAQT